MRNELRIALLRLVLPGLVLNKKLMQEKDGRTGERRRADAGKTVARTVFGKKKKDLPCARAGADISAGRPSLHIGRDLYRETSPLVKSKPALLQ